MYMKKLYMGHVMWPFEEQEAQSVFWLCWFLFYSFQTADPPWIINMGLLWHKVKRHTTLPLPGTYQRRCVWKYPGRSMLTWERKQCRGRSWEAARPAGRKPGLYMSTKSRIEVRKKYILPQVNDFIKPYLQTLKMFFANIKTVYILKVLQTAGQERVLFLALRCVTCCYLWTKMIHTKHIKSWSFQVFHNVKPSNESYVSNWVPSLLNDEVLQQKIKQDFRHRQKVKILQNPQLVSL